MSADVSLDRRFEKAQSIIGSPIRSVMCVPVRRKDTVKGIIQVESHTPTHAFSEDDLQLMAAIADIAASALDNARLHKELSRENKNLRLTYKVKPAIISNSSIMKDVLQTVAQVAPTEATILIRGENGTGKELIAKKIHFESHRHTGPFISVNCAALTESLLESELFGHEAGAFTDAKESRIGRFEMAEGGTIFLDEIGETKPETQMKLLRVLQEREFERVGGTKTIKANVRVLAATNKDLEKALEEGSFRIDLYYRLKVVDITLPPLKLRSEDIPVLAKHFASAYAQEMGMATPTISPEVLLLLAGYTWPGNVRELKNAIERAIILGDKQTIQPADLPSEIRSSSSKKHAFHVPDGKPLTLAEAEKQHIIFVLNHTNWNKRQTARLLNIARTTLDRKIDEYKITKI
ncbi:MAG: sigma-54-dependent Fis family transcriptional regulator [Candidatus Theseobacter exili]|nr:sigma-54-dependent Fis family transcriptional regulator [Candidatus Theseobacter exili]